MKTIKLTRNKEAIVDDEDYPSLSRYKWHCSNKGYACRAVRRNKRAVNIIMHRQILNAPKGKIIDHINRNRLDNRKLNLRFANSYQNGYNHKKAIRLGKPTSSIYIGVSWNKATKFWDSYLAVDGKRLKVGNFKNERHAAMARDIAARDLHGEYATFNFSKIP